MANYKETQPSVTLILGKIARTKWRRLAPKLEEKWWSRELEYRIRPMQDTNTSWPDRIFPGGWYFVEVANICHADREREFTEWMQSELGLKLDKDYAIAVIDGERYHPDPNQQQHHET